jgi:cytochrome P450 family 2 subfamily U polypeptide 1
MKPSIVAKERGSPVCINGLINKAVANVICSIVFGKRFEYDDEKFHNFVFAITETVINKYIPKVNLFPVLRFVPG